MAEGPETRLVKKMRAALSDRYPGCWHVKQHGGQYSQVGVPDILVCIEGHFLALEVKAPRDGESDATILSRVTPLQSETLAKLRKAGAIAEVVWDVDQMLETIERLLPRRNYDEQKDARIYAMADHEDKLRRRVEELEGELYDLAAERMKRRGTD